MPPSYTCNGSLLMEALITSLVINTYFIFKFYLVNLVKMGYVRKLALTLVGDFLTIPTI